MLVVRCWYVVLIPSMYAGNQCLVCIASILVCIASILEVDTFQELGSTMRVLQYAGTYTCMYCQYSTTSMFCWYTCLYC